MTTWIVLAGLASAQTTEAPPANEIEPAPIEAEEPEVEPPPVARDAPTTEGTADPPLAVPVGQEPPPEARRPARSGQPLAVPGRRPLTPEDVAAVRTYRREHLSVRGYREAYIGSTTPTTGYYGRWGGWGGGWAWTQPYLFEVEGWAVYQGSHRLAVPEALERLGDPGARVHLERRMRRNKTAGTALYVLGGVSLVSSIVGLVGLDGSRSYDEARVWSTFSTASMLTGAGCFVAGSFPLGKARRLAIDPSYSLSRADAERRADEANDRLRAELGLTPEQALRLENATAD